GGVYAGNVRSGLAALGALPVCGSAGATDFPRRVSNFGMLFGTEGYAPTGTPDCGRGQRTGGNRLSGNSWTPQLVSRHPARADGDLAGPDAGGRGPGVPGPGLCLLCLVRPSGPGTGAAGAGAGVWRVPARGRMTKEGFRMYDGWMKLASLLLGLAAWFLPLW